VVRYSFPVLDFHLLHLASLLALAGVE